MTGLVAIAAVVGSAVPAVSAAAATTPVPAVARPGAAVSAGLSETGSRISCGSATACLAVGTNTGSSGNQSIPFAEAMHGTAWKSVAVKAPKGAAATALTGVSCKSSSYCLVVGGYSDSAQNTHPAAWTWNGSTLTPLAALPLPKGDSLVSLSAVSCVAVKNCVVIGSAVGTSTSFVQLIWTWNGSKWALKTATLPGTAADTQLSAAHCFSPTSCVVAGLSVSLTGKLSESVTLATWNGKAFTPQKAAVPTGLGLGILEDVSCSSPRSCAAVGISVSTNASASATGTFGFAEVWNGKAWSATKWTGQKGASIAALLGVSCTSAVSCVAVGAQGSEKSLGAVSLIFNGSHWSVRPAPSPGKGLSSDFEGVSCTKSNSCVAIGEYGPSTATSGKPLAGYWNGSAWKLKHA
jgi:hypothetical protein